MDTHTYRFGGFELQPLERRLLDAGTAVTIGPRAFRVLVALVERAGQLVTKDELLAAAWPGVVVEENALQAQVSALRKILGVKAITTVSRGGYRFETTVERTAPQVIALKGNLPQPVTEFIGRDKELREISELLQTTRVLTLTGTGGCGKTRLALQVSLARLGSHADEIWFVELAAVADGRLVPQAVARALEVREREGRTLTQAVCDSLADRSTLVLLDNAEHVLEASAALVHALVHACPNLQVLVTSRERLDIEGEVAYRLPSLAVPSSSHPMPDDLRGNDSVRLFIDRARAIRPHFDVTAENAAALASVCRRLNGIPLAIELAAPRLRAMSLDEMDQRLDRSLALLTSGSRTAPPRHRTLRALLDWSYDLLSAMEQTLLLRLSCFAGGWTLEAAEQVCTGDSIEADGILDLLTSLADKSLVMVDEILGATRYSLLETVRQYAAERARESDTWPRWQARHLDYCLDIAERTRRSTATPEHAKWLAWLDVEHDNLRAALAWSATEGGDVALGLRLGASLWRFWWMRGYSGEGSKALLALLAIAPPSLDPAIRVEALMRAALLLTYAGDFATARTLNETALPLARTLGDQRALALLLTSVAVFHKKQGEHERTRRHEEEALAIWRTLGERRMVGHVLGNLATTVCQLGDPRVALDLHRESLAIRRESADRWAIATELLNLSTTLRELGELPAAKAACEEALAIYREFGEVPGTAAALGRLGGLACDEGHDAVALRYLTEGMRLFAQVGDRIGVAEMLAVFGYACMGEDPARAASLWGAAEHLREEVGTSRSTVDTLRYGRLEALARAALADDAGYDAAWRSGRMLGLGAAADYALATRLRGFSEPSGN